MQHQFVLEADLLTSLLDGGDTTGVWIHWSEIVERSVVTALGIVEEGDLGHGVLNTTEKKTHVLIHGSKYEGPYGDGGGGGRTVVYDLRSTITARSLMSCL